MYRVMNGLLRESGSAWMETDSGRSGDGFVHRHPLALCITVSDELDARHERDGPMDLQ